MKLLVVDDDRVTQDLLREVFEKEGYETLVVGSAEQALPKIKESRFDIVLTDFRMLEMDGLQLLTQIKKLSPETVVILMTGFGTMEGAIQAIQKGAFDYISKPFQLDELKGVVARAVKHSEDIRTPGHSLDTKSATPLETRALLGKSPLIVEVYKTLARATLSPSNVLIIGESGTGKELVARGIHENSPRRSGKFIAVNCGALTETLLESELFGHVKGAFTGALVNKVGLFEEAQGGTIFLDEIGDITPALQVKLLRVLQDGDFKPVGSHESKKADVRVIAATHRNLEEAVAEGKFREDLYYRLKVIRIELPPLRSRMEDLPELVNFFLARYSDRIGKRISHVSDEALKLLQAYPWPGNVRELEHSIEHAVTMTRTNVLYPEDFPEAIRDYERGNLSEEKELPPTSLEEVERKHILKVLEDVNFNKSKAAAILGIDRKTLHRKAQKYRIQLPDKG